MTVVVRRGNLEARILLSLLVVGALAVLIVPLPALAQSINTTQLSGGDWPGRALVQFAANYIIAPLALIAIALSIVSSFFDTKIAKVALYVAISGAFVFFILRSSDTVIRAIAGGV